ncbi:hypothetical protein ABPG75_000341 [Micractinium tetrahymenae]
MGASSSRPGPLASGCWPLLRRRRRSSSGGSSSKVTVSTQTDMECSPSASNGLDKGAAAASASGTTAAGWAAGPAPPSAPWSPPVAKTPGRSVRLSLDSMAGDEHDAEAAGLPAAEPGLPANSASCVRRQLPPVEEAPAGAWGEGEEEAERLAELYHVPVAAVNLITNSRLVFASVAGELAERWGTSTDRTGAFCEALLLPQVHTLLCVPDTMQDYRFRCLSCVAEDPGVRFYAGTPLVSSRGHRLGSLCIFDLKPRRLSADALNLLACLAEMAARLLEEHQVAELEREQRQRRAAERTALQRDPAALRLPILLCDAADPRWPIIWSNAAAASLAGLPQRMLHSKSLFEVFASVEGASAPPAVKEAARQQRPCSTLVALPGVARWVQAQLSPASQQLLDGAQSHPHVDVSAALRAGGSPVPDTDLGLYFVAMQAF